MITKSVSELAPNDVINVLSGWYRVRSLRHSAHDTTINLQRKDDHWSPFLDMTCIYISIDKDLDIQFEVKK